MCRESKLQDIQLCSKHVVGVAKHDVEVAFLNVRKSTFPDPGSRGGPYRNKRNGDLGRFREESFESWFSAS